MAILRSKTMAMQSPLLLPTILLPLRTLPCRCSPTATASILMAIPSSRPPMLATTYPPYNPAYQHDQLNHAVSEHHRHGRNEHVAEVGAVAAGAFAMYELHEAKVDPVHAGRHKLEAEVAGAAALGSAAYAFHEHREKKKDEHFIGNLGGHDGSHQHHHHKHHNFW